MLRPKGASDGPSRAKKVTLTENGPRFTLRPSKDVFFPLPVVIFN